MGFVITIPTLKDNIVTPIEEAPHVPMFHVCITKGHVPPCAVPAHHSGTKCSQGPTVQTQIRASVRESAVCLARFSAGNTIAARMAMIAMTTKSSISVNATCLRAPRFSKRASARLPASFHFIAFGYANPVAVICRWRAGVRPTFPRQRLRDAGLSFCKTAQMRQSGLPSTPAVHL